MTTLADVIEETKAILLTTQQDPLNKLQSSIDADDTSITTVESLKALVAGKRFSIDLEDFYIWEATAASNGLRVQRGMNGSTPAAHAADDLIIVTPKFSPWDITRAINNELKSFPSQGIWRVSTLPLTYLASENSYDLTGVTSIDRIVDVTYDEPGSTKHWPKLKSYTLRRGADTDDFASGYAITLFESAYPGREFRVTYSHDFDTPFAALDDDVLDDIGLASSAHDILSLGAALRLSGYREMGRNLHEGQGDSRRAGEVPPRSALTSMEPYARMYVRRVAQEAANFIGDYPYRKRIPA